MDEMAALRRFRQRVPPPSEAARAAAQTKLAARAHARNRSPWRPALRLTGGLVVASGIALLSLMLGLGRARDGGPIVNSTVYGALAATARQALLQPVLRIPPHAYAHQHVESGYILLGGRIPGLLWTNARVDQDTWIAADGSAHLRQSCLFTTCPPWPRRDSLWQLRRIRGPRLRLESPTKFHIFLLPPPMRVTRHLPRGTVDLAHVDGLSVNALTQLAGHPREILRRIRAVSGYGPTSHLRAFLIVGDLLLDPTAPPTLRSSLFKALALFKPVGVTNPHVFEGQWGISIRVSEGLVNLEFDFNAKTTRLLGYDEWLERLTVPGQPTFFDLDVEGATYGPIQIVRAIPPAKRFPG